MKKKIFLILVSFLLVLPIALAVEGNPYQDYDAFISTPNETFTGDTPVLNWTPITGCSASGGNLVCAGAITRAMYQSNKLINSSTMATNSNYTIFDGYITLNNNDDYDIIGSTLTDNTTSYVQRSVEFRVNDGGDVYLRRCQDGEIDITANGWKEDSTKQHIQIVVKKVGVNVYVYLLINGTHTNTMQHIAECEGITDTGIVAWTFGRNDGIGLGVDMVVTHWVSYNGSIYNRTTFAPPEIINNTRPIINVTYPTDFSTIANTTDYPLLIYGNVTVQNGTIHNTTINSTDWVNRGNNTNFNFTYNGANASGWWVLNISSNSTTHGNRTDKLIYFMVDLTLPIMVSDLQKNSTIIYAYTNLTFNINITDNEKVYSFNVSTTEGYSMELTNVNTTKYIYNGSINVSNYGVGKHVLTSESCDAHTTQAIPNWNNQIGKDYDVKFNFIDDYITIRPLDKTTISSVLVNKETDRYTFTYTKNALNQQQNIEFLVVSSNYIDIIGNTEKYSGWLVIPKLKKWIDFNTNEKEKLNYVITRVNSNTVNIRIEGLKGNIFTFNSIGSLNCIKKDYAYYIYNYTVNYDVSATSNTPTPITLIIDYKDFVLNSTATLTYNTTSYTTSNVSSNNQFNFTMNVTPSVYSEPQTSINLSFNYTINNTLFYTINYTQIVDTIFLVYFGNLSNTSAINFTFYDELNNTNITNAIVSGTFNYLTNSIFYPSLTNTNNLTIAIYPPKANTTGSYVVYYSAPTYPQRRYAVTNAIYNNNTQVIRLYMLETTKGGYATFRVEDIYSNPLSSVTGKVQKTIGGSTVTVEQQTTDDSGLATFFVDPDSDYIFTFSKTGYKTYTATIRPITSEIYTITLEEEGTTSAPSYAIATHYLFTPTNTVLNNKTNYNFTFNLTSSYWEITSCTLTLKNASNTLASSSASYTTSKCSIQIELNTGNQTTIISEATYGINGTTTETVSVQYSVRYTYRGTFSLWNFIQDIKVFSEAGFNDFTRMVLAFIVIFSLVAYLSSNYSSLRDPEVLIILAWVLVLFFSYVGFLTMDLKSIPDIVGLKQYIIFYLFTLGAGSYLIRRHL
jgi:hypothetical protein